MSSTRSKSETTEVRNQAVFESSRGLLVESNYDDGTYYCAAPRMSLQFHERFANERELVAMMAAAPFLLEALIGMADAYVALLLMKAEDPSRFQEPGSPYAKAKAAIAKALPASLSVVRTEAEGKS